MTQFWLSDYTVLYNDNNYVKFIPTLSMTRIEQLNAVTRFAIYVFILILLFGTDYRWIYFSCLTIVICIILFKIDENHAPIINNSTNNNIINVNENNNIIIADQDEEDKYVVGSNLSIPELPLVSTNKRPCTKPTDNNPFMNFLLSDYIDNPNKPSACNIVNELDRDKINDDATNKFNINLYRDLDDLFEKKNSQRQFYTTAVTTNPNDQKAFAEWLYKVPETCKTNQVNCLKYEDLRYVRV